MTICFGMGAIMVGRFTYVMVHKHQAQRSIASVGAGQMNGKMNQQAMRKAQLAKKIQAYFTKVGNELGKDNMGNLAMVLFLRQLAPQTVAQDPKLRYLCTSKKNCPISLADVYKVGLNRLDANMDIPAKEVIQQQLVASDLPQDVKLALLTQNMTLTKINSMPFKSKMADKTKVLLAPNTKYMLFTGQQLLQLKMQSPQYVHAMLDALGRSRDEVARQIVAKALVKAYPSQAKSIFVEAKKMGIKLAAN